MRILLSLLLFTTFTTTAVEISRILQDNPLIAKMSMFQNDDQDDKIYRFSAKRSPSDPVSDNFPERYHFTNESMFEAADAEPNEIDYREFPEVVPLHPPPTGRLLSSDDDDIDEGPPPSPRPTTRTTTRAPFIASATLFDTTVSQMHPTISTISTTKTSSPYFTAFPPTTTPSPWSSEDTRMFFGNSIEDSGEEEEEVVEEEVTTMGLPHATFKGTSYMARGTVEMTTTGPTMVLEAIDFEEPSQNTVEATTIPIPRISRQFDVKRDQNEAINYNGRYAVSATKYYVDNRIDGQHYLPQHYDPFAVEKEMRTNARMLAAKTHHSQDPLTLEMDPKREESEDEDTVSHVEHIQRNGKNVEVRKNVYKNEATVVELWNRMMHGHDYLRYPGAVFDEKFDLRRRKSGDEKVFASKILLSNSPVMKEVHSAHLETNRPKTKGVPNHATNSKIRPLWKITEDIVSVCFNSKPDTGIASSIQPFSLEEDLEQLECLKMCADDEQCNVVTYSEPLKVCEMYSGGSEQEEIRLAGKSLHRTLGGIGSGKCIDAFDSDDFRFAANSASKELEEEEESSSPYLRLVEKDNTTPHAVVVPLSPPTDQPKCGDDESVIFVRSDEQEASLDGKKETSLEITEDDCVFACLTNTRPGGGEPLNCLALEYDRRRGLCYLMQNSPQDETMTPKPVNPVVLYEKTCVTQPSAAKCSGGQPIRFRQRVLIGHLIDAQSVETAAECIDLCISKSATCFSIMFYYDETSLNCILNDSNHLSHPKAFFEETNAIVDFFSIQECLGLREIRRKLFNKRRIIQ